MNILALETTERIGSVAAAVDDHLLCEMPLDPHKRSAQSLAPGIQALLDRVGWRPGEVELVATAVGPGSFTGLRVGVATAKAFAYSVGAEVLGIDTLEAIAARAPAHVARLSVAVDAQRGQVVAQPFARDAEGWFRPVGAAELRDVGAWLAGIGPGVLLTGPILRKVADRVADRPDVLDPPCWSPAAATLAQLAARDFARGRRDDLWALRPRYSRPSAAEEKRGQGAT